MILIIVAFIIYGVYMQIFEIILAQVFFVLVKKFSRHCRLVRTFSHFWNNDFIILVNPICFNIIFSTSAKLSFLFNLNSIQVASFLFVSFNPISYGGPPWQNWQLLQNACIYWFESFWLFLDSKNQNSEEKKINLFSTPSEGGWGKNWNSNFSKFWFLIIMKS